MRVVRAVRYGVAVVVIGVLLVAFPPSARSKGTDATAEFAALGAVGTIACWTVKLAAEDGQRDDQAEEDSYAREGWLVGAAATYASDLYESDVESVVRNKIPSQYRESIGNQMSLSLKNSLGFQGRAGYRCHRRFSAEVEVEWLNAFEGTAFRDNPDLRYRGKVGSIDFEPLVVTTNAKGYVLTGRYQPFLLVGGGFMKTDTKIRDASGSRRLRLPDSDSSSTEFTLRFGGGLDFYATKHVVLTLGADYVLPFGDLDALDYLSLGLGLQYRF